MEPNQQVDTICAISTAPGVGGIAVARVSGPDAFEIVDKIWQGRRLAECESHTAHLGTVIDTQGKPLDQAVATIYRGPRSFTGDDTVEIAVHGSRWIQRELIDSLCRAGCRLAEAGEFTRRAFSSGKMDLAEAEAVADMIASTSRAAHRIASTQMRGHYSAHLGALRDKLIDLAALLELELDFSEEEVEFASREKLRTLARELQDEISRLTASFRSGAAIKDGVPVAIIGSTNAGKSSLLNALVGDDRAIVSSIHGTTRDIIEDTIEIGDYLFRFQDTAGLRTTDDTIERIGIDRSLTAAQKAHIVILVIDLSDTRESQTDDLAAPSIIYLNKTDLVDEGATAEAVGRVHQQYPRATVISGTTSSPDTIAELRQALTDIMDREADSGAGDILVTNARHVQALTQALDSVSRVIQGLDANLSGDFIAQDIRETIHHLAAITGDITTPDLLATIFSRFCIGK
ncbi:MAG: tRNA uridine-5-carboxymethylaminomethyl(34) synthesis GTPase MnmE [Muribaculaceae bacterium]|nr:tRNA uridine-5-carboxymethylaminomethyl(34) synthesis GTPase MnmE [Muribaculaceae bacterium]